MIKVWTKLRPREHFKSWEFFFLVSIFLKLYTFIINKWWFLSLSLSLFHRYPDLEIVTVQYLTSCYEVCDTRKRFFSRLFSFFFSLLSFIFPLLYQLCRLRELHVLLVELRGPTYECGWHKFFSRRLGRRWFILPHPGVLCTFYNTDSNCLPNKWEIPFELKTV